MKRNELKLINAFVIEFDVYGDQRGWFTESYNRDNFLKLGIETEFIQDNHSFSKEKGVLRGLHFQLEPKAQTKLVRCTKGKILDVIVDLRKNSPTYLQHEKVLLSEDNFKQLYVPKGFAHGFLTLTDDVEVQYKVDEVYSKEHDRSIRYNDPQLGIEWEIEDPILSQKDANAPLLKDTDASFIFGGTQ